MAANLIHGHDSFSSTWIQNFRSEEAAKERRAERRAAKNDA